VRSQLPRAAKSATACSVSERVRTFVREQFADEPGAGSQIEAAPEALDINERALIAAADELGVRRRHGQWWPPGYKKHNSLT
jgi:hypothetical protein